MNLFLDQRIFVQQMLLCFILVESWFEFPSIGIPYSTNEQTETTRIVRAEIGEKELSKLAIDVTVFIVSHTPFSAFVSPAVKAFALTDYNCIRNFCLHEQQE